MNDDDDLVMFYGYGDLGEQVDEELPPVFPPTFTGFPATYDESVNNPTVVDSAHTLDVSSITATITWTHDYWLGWTQPDNQWEAERDGQEELDEVLASLASEGITFGQVSPVRANYVDVNWGVDDYEFSVDVNVLSMSTSLAAEVLENRANMAEIEHQMTTGGTLNIQVAGAVPMGFMGTTGGPMPPWIKGLILLTVAIGGTSVVISFTGDELGETAREVGESLLTPLAVVALLYLGSKA